MVGRTNLIGLLLALGIAAQAQANDAPPPVDCHDKAKLAQKCHEVEGGCIAICSSVEPDKAAECKKGCEDLRPVCEAVICSPPATSP
jgi:hypothetical protein